MTDDMDALLTELETLRKDKERAAPVLVSAIEVGKWWRIQDGISALALEELADAVKTYLGEDEVEKTAPEEPTQ